MARSTQEIVDRIVALKGKDLLNTQISTLMDFLSIDDMAEALRRLGKPFTPEELETAKRDGLGPDSQDPEAVIQRMREYMSFAQEKARRHRGISASRSIEHFKAWLWVLCDDDLLGFCEDDSNYTNYGAPMLAAICAKYGFPFPEEGGLANMAKGLPCSFGCSEGCGR